MHHKQESPWWSFIIVVMATVTTGKGLSGDPSSPQQNSSQPCTLGRASGFHLGDRESGRLPAQHTLLSVILP